MGCKWKNGQITGFSTFSRIAFLCFDHLGYFFPEVNILLDEHKKEPATDWITIVEQMRDKWNCYDFQHFINGVKKENPRYLKEQFSAINAFLDKEAPDRKTVAAAMKYWIFRCAESANPDNWKSPVRNREITLT
ncbi:MAG: hypothetical protein ACOX4R_04345 [Lentihominibacter sp.]